MNTWKLLLIIAIMGLIGVLFAGCGDKDGGEEAGAAAGPEGGSAAGPGGPEGMPGGDAPGGAEAAGPSGPSGAGPGGAGPGGAASDTGGSEEVEAPVVELSAGEISAKLADAKTAKSEGDIDAALKLATDVIKSDPSNVEANWLAAWILASKDDTALAIGQFERVLKLGLDAKRANQARAAVNRLKAREE